MRAFFRTAFAIAITISPIACDSVTKRPERVAVTSSVTFANGQPVKDVMCCFLPHTARQLPAEFPLDGSGNVAKTANGVEPKLLPGKYTVYFQPIERPGGAKYVAAFKLVPERYTQQGGTGLEVDINPDGGQFVLRLES